MNTHIETLKQLTIGQIRDLTKQAREEQWMFGEGFSSNDDKSPYFPSQLGSSILPSGVNK